MPYTPEQYALAFGAGGPPVPGTQQAPQQVAQPAGGAAPVNPALAVQPPDFLAHFLQHFFGPHLAAQDALGQGRLGLQQSAIFGRHLGMDGQPIASTPTQPLTFDQLRRNPADIANDERQTFGRSFTAGERNPGWTGDQGQVTRRETHPWVSGPNPAWVGEPGGYSMLLRGQRNPWSFATMAGSAMPTGAQGPMQQPSRLF